MVTRDANAQIGSDRLRNVHLKRNTTRGRHLIIWTPLVADRQPDFRSRSSGVKRCSRLTGGNAVSVAGTAVYGGIHGLFVVILLCIRMYAIFFTRRRHVTVSGATRTPTEETSQTCRRGKAIASYSTFRPGISIDTTQKEADRRRYEDAKSGLLLSASVELVAQNDRPVYSRRDKQGRQVMDKVVSDIMMGTN